MNFLQAEWGLNRASNYWVKPATETFWLSLQLKWHYLFVQ